MAEKRMVFAIGRRCGSGGHEVGKRLAEHYGINFYDKEIVTMLAERMNMSEDEITNLEEKVTGHFRAKNGFNAAKDTLMGKITKSDRLYLSEYALISNLAATENCVIVGRSGNAILADNPHTLHLHIFADDDFRIPRVMEQYNLSSEAEAKKMMDKVDKERRDYFNYYTGNGWGTTDTHDFMINSATFGIDETVDIIIGIADRFFAKQED